MSNSFSSFYVLYYLWVVAFSNFIVTLSINTDLLFFIRYLSIQIKSQNSEETVSFFYQA